MKRPWFSLGLLMFLSAFCINTGMLLVFIPLFFCMFLFIPNKRLFLLLPFLFLRILWIPAMPLGECQDVVLVEPLSPLSQEVAVHVQGQQYFLRKTRLEPGYHKASFRCKDFSKKRSLSGFSEKDYYSSKGFRGEIDIVDAELLEKKAFSLYKIREALYQRTEVFGSFQGLVYSLLFGIKEGLDPGEKELFSQLGLLHLFVVSGLHLGIYRRFFLKLVFVMKGPRILGDLLAFVMMFFLCMVSYFHVSTLRSLAIYGLSTFSFYRKEKLDTLESLGCVSFFLLLYRPSFATSFSFLLGSFAYGILSLSKRRHLICMYLLMLPFQLLFLRYVKFSSYLLNGLLGFLMGALLPILSLGLIFSFLAAPLIILLQGMMGILRFIDNIPFSLVIGPLGMVAMIAFYTALLLRELLKEEMKMYSLSLKKRYTVIFLLLLFLFHGFEGEERRTGIHFFDVGQGDSSLVVTEKGRTILIDTGKGKKVHEALHWLGIGEIDVLILSHFDEDHSAEVDRLQYKKLYHPLGSHYPEGMPLTRGDSIVLDNVVIRVLSPEQPKGDSNEDSLVFYLEAYGHRILYTGDVSKKILSTLEAERTTLLKFPHHGSKSSLSDSFVDSISPQILFLSYGRNRYGHPHEEVLQHAMLRKYTLFRTFEDGNLQLKKNGYRSY